MSSIQHDSFVYDVFAGVGPFAVPLGRKKSCTVYANDLNPSSFEYLQKNVTLNKMKGFGCVHCSNLDGREFIKTVVRNHLTERILNILESSKSSSVSQEEPQSEPLSYVIMNLPGLAVEFLDAFTSLLKDIPDTAKSQAETWACVLPTVHCYSFTSKMEDMRDDMKSRAESALGHPLPQEFEVRYVRNVAPKKEMVCLSFKLSPDLVLFQHTSIDGDINEGMVCPDEMTIV